MAFTSIDFDASLITAPNTRTSISNTFDRTGWVAGFGIEHSFSPNWSIALEYVHMDFGSEHVTLDVTNSGITQEKLRASFDIDTVTARLNYRF